jgi:hypothetical protein
MRPRSPNCSAAASDSRLAARRADVSPQVHGRPGRNASRQPGIAALAENPEPLDAFVRGGYRRLRVGDYRVLYEVEADVVTIVRVDKVR